MRFGRLAAVAACFALTACGSTVQLQGTAAQDGGLSQGGAVPTAPQAGGTTGGDLTGTTGGVGTGTSGVHAGTTGSAGPQVPVVSTQPPAGVGSATKAPVEVGVVLFPDVNAYAGALGVASDVGDQRAMSETMVGWVNANGGLNGHRVKPVYFEVELTSTQPYAVTYEEICSHFTEDHKVVAVLIIANVEPALARCLAKTKTPLVVVGRYMYDAQDYRSLWNMVGPMDVGVDRIARTLVGEIATRNLVKRGEKLGLLVFNVDGSRRARDQIVIPAMKARGADVVTYEIPYPQSTPEIANSASVVQSAQLAMAAQGVKTMMFLCPGCFTFFITYAENQGYYPTYVLSSVDGLTKRANHGRSMAKVHASAWDPTRDQGVYKYPHLLKGNPTYELCRTIEKANYSNDDSVFAALGFCGMFHAVYQAARVNAASPVTGLSLLGGLNAFGTSYDASFSFPGSTRITAQQHDGVTRYRTMHYESGCDCMVFDKGAPLKRIG